MGVPERGKACVEVREDGVLRDVMGLVGRAHAWESVSLDL